MGSGGNPGLFVPLIPLYRRFDRQVCANSIGALLSAHSFLANKEYMYSAFQLMTDGKYSAAVYFKFDSTPTIVDRISKP
jgi:hypothetical protein